MTCKTKISLSIEGCYLVVETDGKKCRLKKSDLEPIFCKKTDKIIGLKDSSNYTSINYDFVEGFDSEQAITDFINECVCKPLEVEVTETEPEKQFLYFDTIYFNTDIKKENPVQVEVWRNPDGTSCVINCETELEIPKNILKTDFIMANVAGNYIPPSLAEKTTSACVTLCVPAGTTITFADVLAEAISDGILLPDGTPPTGFLLGNITKFSIGQLGKDPAGVTKKDGVQVVYYNTDEAINAGSTYCPDQPTLIDDDCDGFFTGYDATETIENPNTVEDALIRVCATFIPFDADDTDETVQRTSGEGKSEETKG